MATSALKKHQNLAVGWLTAQCVSIADAKLLKKLLDARKDFLRTSAMPSDTTRKTIHLRQGSFSVSLSSHYSFLRVLPEIFRDLEHAQHPDFDKPQQVVIDIGACEGYYSVRMAKKSPDTIVYAYEPNPEAFEALRLNAELNSLENRIVCFNIAVTHENQTLKLHRIPGVPNISALDAGEAASSWLKSSKAQTVDVPALTLIRAIEDNSIQKVDLLKIDAEGAELEVLLSAAEKLKIISKIVVECHSLHIRNQIVKLLTKHGFSLLLEKRDDNSNFSYLGNLYFARNRCSDEV